MAIKDDDCIHSLEKGLYKFLLRSQIGPEAPCWLFTEIKKKRKKENYRKQKRKERGKQEEDERE